MVDYFVKFIRAIEAGHQASTDFMDRLVIRLRPLFLMNLFFMSGGVATLYYHDFIKTNNSLSWKMRLPPAPLLTNLMTSEYKRLKVPHIHPKRYLPNEWS